MSPFASRVLPVVITFGLAAVSRPMVAQTATPVQPAAPQARATAAADSLLEARVREVSLQLRCPVCMGLSLQDSPAELSQEMKDVVREQLRAGRTPAEVKQYFVGRYGEWILMEPPAHGFNWVVYLLPALVLAGGAAGLTIAVRRWTANAPAGAEPVVAGDEGDAAFDVR